MGCEWFERVLIEMALVGFESPSHGFNLSSDIDKGFSVSKSRNPGILEISKHDSEFWTRRLSNSFRI
jgi:hypothetical protein